MGAAEAKAAILANKTALGIEFGSTRIKAVLVDDKNQPIASGGHEWENRYENGVWTYSLDDIWTGIQDCYQDMARDVKKGTLDPEEITEETISDYLDTKGLPDPDLLIRTSGEERLSNYLLWQLAYTEFYFTDVPWPDFDKTEFVRAIEKYNGRDRRFGGVKEE